MITYTLTWPEQLFAAIAGVMRQISGINRGRPEPYGTPKDPWGGHVGTARAATTLNNDVVFLTPLHL